MKYLLLLLNKGSLFGQEFLYSCPDDLADPVVRAFNTWNLAADGSIKFQRVTDNANLVIDFGNDSMFFGKTIGLTWMLSPILIYIKPNNPNLYPCMVHEIGHALGLKHNDDPESIMFPTIPIINSINQADVDNVRALFGLSSKVFDFKVKINGHRVQVITDKKSEFVFSDGSFEYTKKLVHRFPKGVFIIKCYYNNMILIKKEVTIK